MLYNAIIEYANTVSDDDLSIDMRPIWKKIALLKTVHEILDKEFDKSLRECYVALQLELVKLLMPYNFIFYKIYLQYNKYLDASEAVYGSYYNELLLCGIQRFIHEQWGGRFA